jgi:hypothetical protein
MNGGHRAEPEMQSHRAKGAFASYLVQQTGGRDWSAQEVAHVTMGFPTVIGSHRFVEKNVGNKSQLRAELDADAPDDDIADNKNHLDDYFSRLKADNMHPGGRQTTLDRFIGTSSNTSLVDREEIRRCSFSEFWRNYEFKSAGRGNGHQIVRRSEPIPLSQ